VTRYTKSIIALIGALATWGVTAAEDGVYSQVELWGALLALATAAGVYALPNSDLDEGGQAALWFVILGAIGAVILLALTGELDL
jgi:hypothetical protein